MCRLGHARLLNAPKALINKVWRMGNKIWSMLWSKLVDIVDVLFPLIFHQQQDDEDEAQYLAKVKEKGYVEVYEANKHIIYPDDGTGHLHHFLFESQVLEKTIVYLLWGDDYSIRVILTEKFREGVPDQILPVMCTLLHAAINSKLALMENRTLKDLSSNQYNITWNVYDGLMQGAKATPLCASRLKQHCENLTALGCLYYETWKLSSPARSKQQKGVQHNVAALMLHNQSFNAFKTAASSSMNYKPFAPEVV